MELSSARAAFNGAPAFPYEFATEVRERARRYERSGRKLRLAGGTAYPVAVAIAFLASGLSQRLAEFCRAAAPASPSTGDALYIVLFSLFFAGITLPVGFYLGFLRERKWGMTRRSSGAFFREALKGVAVGVIFACALLLPFYYIVRRFEMWWLIAGLLYCVFLVVSDWVMPNLLLPIFYKVRPLPEGELRSRILAAAESAGLPKVQSVAVLRESARSPRANAFIHGMGPTRRIVLFDTLIEKFHPREVAFVVAHEVAHLAHKDVPKGLVVGTALVFPELFVLSLVLNAAVPSFGLQSASDVAGIPLLLAFVVCYGFLNNVLLSWFSRRAEARADAFALRKTGDAAAAESMMKRLCDLNLLDDEPAPWLERVFYSHPAPHRRIEAARAFAATAGASGSGSPAT